jgi:hypothetical protein
VKAQGRQDGPGARQIVHCTHCANELWECVSHEHLNPRVQRYLDKARECERLAAQAHDPDVKAAFAEVSRQWRELAGQVERSERDRD